MSAEGAMFLTRNHLGIKGINKELNLDNNSLNYY